jgi:hypothetical protein
MKQFRQGSMLKFVKAQITATLLAAGLIGCACGTAAADIQGAGSRRRPADQ